MNLDAYLPAGISREDALVAMAMLTAFVLSITIWQTLLERDPLGPKMKILSKRRAALKDAFLAPQDSAQDETLDFMRRVVLRFKLLRGQEADKAAQRLTQAGLRTKNALIRYMFARLTLPFVFGLTGMFMLKWFPIIKLSGMVSTLIVMALVVGGAFAPNVYVGNRIQKRRALLEKALPDTLDLLVIAAEAGLSLDAGFNRVALELGPAWPEMSEELTLTSIELTFLNDRRKAMDNLIMRTDMDAIRAVVNTLHQTEKYGTPLAQSLRVLSAEFRNNRMMKAEEKAARLPVLMTLPMVMFILPPLFIVLIGPAILGMIDHLSKF